MIVDAGVIDGLVGAALALAHAFGSCLLLVFAAQHPALAHSNTTAALHMQQRRPRLT